jgi:hypothetical protein
MKRAWYLAAVVALALIVPAAAQIRGAPASVTSYGAGRGPTPGTPASVTSVGPNGYGGPCSTPGMLIPSAMGCTSTQFTNGIFFHDGRDHGRVNLGSQRRRRSNTNAYYPVYVPYAYPVAVPAEAAVDDAQPDTPAPTIFENRASGYDPRYGSQYLGTRPTATPATQPQQASSPDPSQQIPVVLIYRDGHQQEVSNYAIVGSTLYDLGTFVAHKIPLADLNLQATIKANDDRGVEFTVPASVKVD